jgi:hypothetical protein
MMTGCGDCRVDPRVFSARRVGGNQVCENAARQVEHPGELQVDERMLCIHSMHSTPKADCAFALPKTMASWSDRGNLYT